ncbi:ShlB/FhaC/HecB family hemolysin secretion/activation protein [uncultured Sphingomonas sp.]|uniref:ShlB/FhaC/HecB family hemolysin secretion/activation protein n=1 Tax=uncultured Sphingomonas sp. TaxID=158754 RepID=UPI0035C99A04
MAFLTRSILNTAGLALLFAGQTAAAQTVLDRVDPSKVELDAPGVPLRVDDPGVDIGSATAATASTLDRSVIVGAITIAGLERLHAADFADVIMAHVGRTLTPADLARLTDLIAERARTRGYVFAQATIPPQSVTAGVLRVALDEGRIDELRIRGADNRAVRAALSPLVGSGPVTIDALERRLLIAGDIDGMWLRRSQFVREGGRGVLVVDLVRDRVVATVGLDNSGSRAIGPIQGDLTVRYSQLFADDDIITLTALATPAEPREFGYARLRYGKRIAADGTEIAASVSYSRALPGSYLRSREIEGRSWTAGLNMLHPLLRRRQTSLWVEGSVGIRTVEQSRAGIQVRRDRLTVARVGTYGFAATPGGRVRTGVTFSQGLGLFDATRRGDPLASRSDAGGQFSSVALSASWTMTPIGGFSAQVDLASQVAARPLLVSEETGLGGGSFLRGYDYSERIGDNAAMASLELRYDLAKAVGPLIRPQAYGFLDGGVVRNLHGGSGGGSLFSAGAGLRTAVTRTATADLNVAVPLSGIRYDSGDRTPLVSFRLTKRF